jgi:hypothetical protein
MEWELIVALNATLLELKTPSAFTTGIAERSLI